MTTLRIEGRDGVQARELVEEDHEGHDQEDGDEPGHEALADGVGAERRADRPFLEVSDPGRKRAGLEDDDQVLGLLDREPPLDDAAVGDPGVDVRGRLDLAVEDDGQLFADVLAGDLLEAPWPFGVQGEGDGGVVPLVDGAADHAQVLARDRGHPADEEEAGLTPLGIALDDLHVLRNRAAEFLEERLLVRGRSGLDELPLEDGRDLDQVLDPLRVGDARELDDDPLRALPLDQRLGDAELVDPVADGLDGLVDGLVLEELGDQRPSG